MRVAAVDIGTNSMRLLITQMTPSGSIDLVRRAVVTGLGRGVDAAGRFDPDAVAATLDVLGGFGAALVDLAPDATRAVATSAGRDAADAGEFLDAAETALGVRPEVISGEAEAELAFLGAASGVQAETPLLVVDVGGGSTEFVYGDAVPEYRLSVDIGSARLTERCLPSLPADGTELDAAGSEADAALAALELPSSPAATVGVAGTVTSLAAIALGLPAYERRAVHGSVLTRDQIGELVAWFGGSSLEEILATPSLDPARAPVILGGAIVLERAMAAAAADEVVVSAADLLDGITLSLARGNGAGDDVSRLR
jgi:exopolyphosphatase/guanosine-5'-triphosphate,3'-diphosphate pyrophosphatase